MLLVRPVGHAVASYFTDGRSPGRWGPGATRLLGMEGPVDRSALVAVLRGRHPQTGEFLPAVRPARRRAGWDLVFAAPKSVSLLAATTSTTPASGEPAAPGTVQAAHRAAVDAVLAWLEERLHARSPAAGPARADGMVAASFTHHHNAASEPHLHSHVLVANLTRAGGRWGAVQNEDWSVNHRAVGALYQLGLRHHLQVAGWELEWRLRPDGLADVADVPRSAVRAASSQAGAVAALGRFEARRRAVAVPWRDRAADAGFSPARPPVAGGTRAAARDSLSDAPLERAVTARLGAARSDFRRADVIVALAACHAGGAPPEAVDRFVDRVCGTAQSVPSLTRGPRWSTVAAARLDHQLEQLLTEMAGRPGRIPPLDPGPHLDRWIAHGALDRGTVRAVRGIVAGQAAAVHLAGPIGAGGLLAQAEVLEACVAAFTAAGLTAAVDAPAGAAPRWALLSGLDPTVPGQPADVVIVDRADRRPTADLLRLAEVARSAGARLILVHGGTMPRLSAAVSRGLAGAAQFTGALLPGPHRPWAPLPAAGAPTITGPGVAARPGDIPARTGREAAAALLSGWLRDPGPSAPLLVGLGLDEVIGLNRAARLLAAPAGGERSPGPPRPGDRVVVLHRGGGPAPYGSFGDIRHGAAGPVVHWDGDAVPPSPLDDRLRRGLRPGWAVTPFLAARSGRPLAVLGPASGVGPVRARVVASIEPPPTGAARALGR